MVKKGRAAMKGARRRTKAKDCSVSLLSLLQLQLQLQSNKG